MERIVKFCTSERKYSVMTAKNQRPSNHEAVIILSYIFIYLTNCTSRRDLTVHECCNYSNVLGNLPRNGHHRLLTPCRFKASVPQIFELKIPASAMESLLLLGETCKPCRESVKIYYQKKYSTHSLNNATL